MIFFEIVLDIFDTFPTKMYCELLLPLCVWEGLGDTCEQGWFCGIVSDRWLAFRIMNLLSVITSGSRENYFSVIFCAMRLLALESSVYAQKNACGITRN